MAAKASGVEGLRIAEYPGAVGVHQDEEIREKVKSVLFDQIIDGLTKPIEGGGLSSSMMSGRDPKEIEFRGTPEQVNKFFISKQWTDGLPITLPTPKRVEAFLKYTSRSPNEPIAILPQANLEAVPWNIAANAVMAGCRAHGGNPVAGFKVFYSLKQHAAFKAFFHLAHVLLEAL